VTVTDIDNHVAQDLSSGRPYRSLCRVLREELRCPRLSLSLVVMDMVTALINFNYDSSPRTVASQAGCPLSCCFALRVTELCFTSHMLWPALRRAFSPFIFLFFLSSFTVWIILAKEEHRFR
jgi:hypothetical protein